MSTIGDIATIALVGGIGYLVLTKTDLGKSSPQIIKVSQDPLLIPETSESTKAASPSENTKIEASLDTGITKRVNVTDSSGNEYSAKTVFGNEGLLVDSLDLVMDINKIVNPAQALVNEKKQTGQEITSYEKKKATIESMNPLHPITNAVTGVVEWIGNSTGWW